MSKVTKLKEGSNANIFAYTFSRTFQFQFRFQDTKMLCSFKIFHLQHLIRISIKNSIFAIVERYCVLALFFLSNLNTYQIKWKQKIKEEKETKFYPIFVFYRKLRWQFNGSNGRGSKNIQIYLKLDWYKWAEVCK